MEISKIWNFEEAPLFRTLRGEIDPGESESDLDSNFQKIKNSDNKLKEFDIKFRENIWSRTIQVPWSRTFKNEVFEGRFFLFSKKMA